MNVREFRKQYPFRPFSPALLAGMEVMPVSYPFEWNNSVWIYCRMDPNNCESAEYIEVSRLSKIN